MGLKYTFEKTADGFKIIKIEYPEQEGKTQKEVFVDKNWKNRVYKFDDENLLEINDVPLVSDWKKDERVAINPKGSLE